MNQRPHSRQSGMSLVEALVSVVLLSLVVIAFLQVFDASAKVAKSQGNISDATENLRFSVAHLVRLTRMAGTGGLPLCYPDAGGNLQPLAVDSDDNTDITAGSLTIGGRVALANSDVLHVRGVIANEFYDIQGSVALTSGSSNGTLTITAASPFSSRVQDLRYPSSPESYPIMIGLQTPLDIMPSTGGIRHYSMYRIVHAADTDPVTLNTDDMDIDYVITGDDVDLNPNGAFETFQIGFAYAAGFLDTYAYFVALNDAGEPSLYRSAGGGDAEELVPNIYTLQVAFGCDINRDEVIQDSEWFEDSDGTNSHPTGDQMAHLREVRISVVARSQDPEMGWLTDVDIPENGDQVAGADVGYRYRVVTVRVALRSHPPLVDA